MRIVERINVVGQWWKARLAKKWYQFNRPSYKEWYVHVFGNYELTVDAMTTMSIKDLKKIHKECMDNGWWMGEDGQDARDAFFDTALAVLASAVMSTRDGQDNAVSKSETNVKAIQLYDDDIMLIEECLKYFGCPPDWATKYYCDPAPIISVTVLRDKYKDI